VPHRLDRGRSTLDSVTIKVAARIGAAGTDMKKVLAGSVSVDPPSIAATTRAAVAVTIVGVSVGDKVLFEPPAALNDDLLFVGARVTATDTVTIYLYNPTGGAIDDSGRTWDYLWFDLT
jgi:hypothetical protein